MNVKAETAEVVDLSTLDSIAAANTGAWMTLKHPTKGDALPGKIKLLGRDSDTWKRLQRTFTNRLMHRNPRKVDIEDADAQDIELLARCTIEWVGIAIHGQALSFSIDNAKRLYTEFPWVREQVNEFIGDRGNFLQ